MLPSEPCMNYNTKNVFLFYHYYYYWGETLLRRMHIGLLQQKNIRMCNIPLFHHCRGVVVKMGAMYKTLQGDKVSFNAKEVWAARKSHLKRDELKCWLRSSGMKKEPRHLVCGRCLTLLPEEEVLGSPPANQALIYTAALLPRRLGWPFCRSRFKHPSLSSTQLTWLRHVSGGGPCSEETHGSAAAVWHSTLFTRRIRL